MNIVTKEGLAKGETFTQLYPEILDIIVRQPVVNSRAGMTWEMLNFNTKIENPLKRCVGGYKRDINVFFLLAEALWIWTGRKDVEFLKIFNERMSDFSDDGESFHAPYGFRLRRHGINSFDKATEENKHSLQGLDQIHLAVKMLRDDPDTRRCVLQIWNADLDLDKASKDLPCNDLLFLKMRDGKLNLTVSNRSNDLHWGLPTNVFQFSTILELLSLVLNCKVGTQNHNSDSLHVYESNPITAKMIESEGRVDLYSLCEPFGYSFPLTSTDPLDRLKELDIKITNVLSYVRNYYKYYKHGESQSMFYCPMHNDMRGHLYTDNDNCAFSVYIFSFLSIYVRYAASQRTNEDRINALRDLLEWEEYVMEGRKSTTDLQLLGMNFFMNRIKGTVDLPIPSTGKLGEL